MGASARVFSCTLGVLSKQKEKSLYCHRLQLLLPLLLLFTRAVLSKTDARVNVAGQGAGNASARSPPLYYRHSSSTFACPHILVTATFILFAFSALNVSLKVAAEPHFKPLVR